MSTVGPLNTTAINTGRLRALPEKVPDRLKFVTAQQGPPATVKEMRLPAQSSSYSTNSDKIVRFFFNNEGIVDFRRGYLNFTLTITGGTGSYLRVAQGIWSIFDRLRLSVGSELEDIRNYNQFFSMFFESKRDEDIADVIGPSLYGFATQAQRNAFSSAPKQYQMPLSCGLFLTAPVPLGLLSQRLQLELYLADPASCIETDSLTPLTITLTDVRFHYEVMALTDEVTRNIAAVANSGVCFPYKKFTHYTSPITSSTQEIVIPHASTGIDAFISFFTNNATRFDTTVNDKFLNWPSLQIRDHTLRINNSYYPLQPTEVQNGFDNQSYIQYLRWIGKFQLGGVFTKPPSISSDDYMNDKFLIVYDLNAYPGEGLVNNLSTEQGGNNVYIRVNLGVPPPANTSLETFVCHTSCIDFAGGIMRNNTTQ
jgi:hypothetical protein